jgi:hypothetical protein
LLRLSGCHTLAVGPSLLGRGGEGTDGSETEEDQGRERNHLELGVLCSRTLDCGLARTRCVYVLLVGTC